MAIHFFATAVLLLSRTYTDQLFLSTYPRSWLPYLFLGQTTVMLGISFAASPLLAGGSVRSNSLVTGGLIASLLLSGAGLFFHVPGAPFVVSLWLYVVAAVITMVAWNVVGDTFEMRQYKKLVKWISAAGNVGAVGSGAAIPLMVAALGGNSLLYIMAGMMTVCVACYPLVPPLPSAPAAVKKKAAASPLRYPLVQQLALTALIMMLVYTVVDYLFKAQVATAYQGDSAAIGSFMGPFYSINQLALMIVQISVPDTLLRSFGINGLLAPMPLLSIAIGGAAILLPGLWPMVISRAFHGVIRYGLDNMGREIALRPLPSAIRNAGKLHVKINASSVGAAIASLLLMVAATRVSNLGIGAAMIGISAVWLYYTLKGTRSYHRTLQEAVGNGRLSVSEDDQGEGARRGGKAVAEFALQSDDEETILFGLGFLEQAEGGAIPPLLIPHLAGGTPEIRIAAARAARGFTPETAAPALVQRLEQEQDPAVTWELLAVLARFEAKEALPAARRLLASEQGRVRAGAALLLLSLKDGQQTDDADEALQGLAASDQPVLRRAVADAIGSLGNDRYEGQLRRLLQDEDQAVRVGAILACQRCLSVALIPELVGHLGTHGTSYYAGRALSELGLVAAPELAAAATRAEPGARKNAVRSLLYITAPEADAAAMELAPQVDLLTRSQLAVELARRARRQGLTSTLSAQLQQLVAGERATLQALGKLAAAADLDEDRRTEVAHRQVMATNRMLHWIAAASRPGEVLDLIPRIMSDGVAAERRSAAIELLDARLDRKLRASLTELDRKYPEAPYSDQLLEEIDDPWLQELFKAGEEPREGETMNTAQRVTLLRKVELLSRLPGEILMTIAEVCEEREVAAGEALFAEGDAPDGLYMIAAGSVAIKRGGQTLVELETSKFFGELALLSNSTRSADAEASADGLILFMDTGAFEQITDEFPDVLRSVIQTLSQYLSRLEGRD